MFRAPLNSAMITALAAITGSLVGAFGSAVGTWITARHQDRRDLLGKQIARREALYSDFIGESVRLLVDAMQHNASDLQNMLPVYALLSRIRLSSSKAVLQKARPSATPVALNWIYYNDNSRFEIRTHVDKPHQVSIQRG